jgi:hypothetical protein
MSDAPPRRRVLRGILLLARLRPQGFAEFAATRQAFLNSLAPLIAFPLVGGVLVLLSGGGIGAVTDLFATLIALLAPAVISEALATRWSRDQQWLRYGVAFNWAQWAVPVVAVVLLMLAGVLRGIGLGEAQAAIAVLFAIAAYGLVLHWFLARHGLSLSAGRSTLLVVAINLGTVALVMAPRFIAAAMR